MLLSGHRNVQIVKNYSSASEENVIDTALKGFKMQCRERRKQLCFTHCCNHHFDGQSGGFVHKNLDDSYSWSLQWSRITWWTIQHNYKYCEQVNRHLCRWFNFYGTKPQTYQTNSWIVGWWRQPTTSMKNFTINWLFFLILSKWSTLSWIKLVLRITALCLGDLNHLVILRCALIRPRD